MIAQRRRGVKVAFAAPAGGKEQPMTDGCAAALVPARRRSRVLVRTRGLLGAFHPGPALAVTAFSVADAAAVGRGTAGTLLAGAAVLAGQCSVGWQNDDLDAERDLASGRRDKPIAEGAASRRSVRAAWLLAGLATVPLSLASGWRAGAVHLVAVGLAWAYNLGLKKTVASPLPYLVSFGLLPCFVTLGLAGSPLPPWWVPAGTALLGLAAHGANVLPDLEADERAGVAGLPQRLGRGATLVLVSAALLAATLLLGLGSTLGAGAGGKAVLAGAGAWALTSGGLAASFGCCAAAVAVALRRSSSRAPFALVIAAAIPDVLIVVLAAAPLR